MLQDPKNLAPTNLSNLDKKISLVKTRMARSATMGGMPFVYAFIATKQHFLSVDVFPKYIDKNGEEKTAGTAATDGKVYYWDPDFLDKLSVRELSLVFAHETYHIVMQHCSPLRAFGKNKTIWNLAIDYVVNSSIEHDERIRLNQSDSSFITKCDESYEKHTEHPIWNGNFGDPYQLKDLIETILSYKDLTPEQIEEKQKESGDRRVTYVDFSIYGRSAESIYDEIMEARKKAGLSEGDFNDIIGQLNSMDSHMEVDIDKRKLLEEMLNAHIFSKKMMGTTPGCISDELEKLLSPKLKWQDIARQALQAVRHEMGSLNDWSRFRRRNLSLGLYSPKKKDNFVRWLCMLDTSGSMSMDDLVYGISQLKCLDGRSEGIVVPCDAQPYFDKAVKIRSMSDLPKINVVGRGGTVFDEFFDNYRSKIKERIDLIIVITDGGFHLNCKKPPVDVVFVCTNDHMPTVPWGRVAPLRTY
jgi:predicted metal-dependent peptidase